jgi:hypothetical protein
MAFACVVRPRVQVLWKGASRRVTIPFVTFTFQYLLYCDVVTK